MATIARLTPADYSLLASLGENKIIADALATLSAIEADYTDAKNAKESAATSEKAAKSDLFATVMQVVCEVGALTTGCKYLREEAFTAVMGAMLAKDYPIATVKVYASTGKHALLKLYDIRSDIAELSYSEVRELLSPKSELKLQFDGLKDVAMKSLGKAGRRPTAEIVDIMASIAELAQRAEQLAQAEKDAKARTTEIAKAVNAMREVPESIGKVASVI